MNINEERSERSGNKVIDDPRQRLLDKLRKILEMQNRGTEAEAATAAGLLQKFLMEHNLSMADLEQRGAKAPEIQENGHDLGKAAFRWKLDLAEGIAEFYYCAPMVDRERKTVKFVGRPDNVESLTLLYGWLIEQIKGIATVERRVHLDATGEHIDPLRWQIAFGEGAAKRLIVRLQDLKAQQAEGLSKNEYGDVVSLAIHHKSEVSDYLEERYGFRTDGRKTKKDLEWEERWKKYDMERKEALAKKNALKVECERNGDMRPFYKAYPNEHPDEVEKRKKAQEKADREWEAKERRNAARRRGDTEFRAPKVDYEAEAQKRQARTAGHKAADRVNLQPFLGGHVDNKKKVGG